MPNKAVSSIVLLALLAGAAWWWRDWPPLRQARADLGAFYDRMAGGIHAPAAGSASRPVAGTGGRSGAPAAAAGKAPAGTRKCVDGPYVLYTNGDCPPGSREQRLDGGTLTVLPAAPRGDGAGAAEPAASSSTLRDLALKPGEPTLKEKAMDKAMDAVR